MKIIRYTLLDNGKIPSAMVDGGYFPKITANASPQDIDLIGFSLGWSGLEEYTTKLDFETYIKSYMSDYQDYSDGSESGTTVLIQDIIDTFWAKSLE